MNTCSATFRSTCQRLRRLAVWVALWCFRAALLAVRRYLPRVPAHLPLGPPNCTCIHPAPRCLPCCALVHVLAMLHKYHPSAPRLPLSGPAGPLTSGPR